VLPRAKHIPSGPSQVLIDGPITSYVSRQLGAPVVVVGSRLVPVERASMPKAAVDEDGEAMAREDDVWAYGSPGDAYEVVLAKAKAASVKRRAHRDLGLRVALAVRSHPYRDLLAGWAWIRESLHRAVQQSRRAGTTVPVNTVGATTALQTKASDVPSASLGQLLLEAGRPPRERGFRP
jgi:hypothetical protein